MTTEPLPERFSGYAPDIFNKPNAVAPVEPKAGLHFKPFRLRPDDPDYKTAIGWEMKLDDFRMGFRQVGDYDRDYGRTATSSLDNRFYRTMVPFLLTTVDNPEDAGASNAAVCSANVFGTQAVAHGSAANKSLLCETSATNPTLVARTFSPASAFACLFTGVIGGATSAEQLFAGFESTAGKVFSDLGSTPTVAGTLHSNLTPLWGGAVSYLNASNPNTGTWLFYANGGIWALAITAAIGDAPTQVGSNMPNGGWVLGVLEPEGYPPSMFMVLPKQNRSTSLAGNARSGTLGGWLGYVNLEGTDLRAVKNHPLRDVWIAFAWKDGIFMSDRDTAYFWNNKDSRDLYWRADRVVDSDKSYKIVGGVPMGDDLYLVYRSITTGTLTETYGVDFYSSALDAWFTVGKEQSGKASGDYAPGAMPWSNVTRYLHYNAEVSATGNSWPRQYIPPPGLTSFALRRTGSGTAYSQAFEAGGGTWTSPYWELPNMEGRRKRIDQIIFLGDADAGGSDATVTVAVTNGPSVTFASGIPNVSQVADQAASGDLFQIQVTITITVGATTTKVPNALPVVIRGRSYFDDPSDVVAMGLPGGF